MLQLARIKTSDVLHKQQVLALERRVYGDNTYDKPWDEATLTDELQRNDRDSRGAILKVEGEEKVVGFAAYEIDKHKQPTRILRLTVQPGLQGENIEGQILKEILGGLKKSPGATVTAEVRETNVPLLKALLNAGFKTGKFIEEEGKHAVVPLTYTEPRLFQKFGMVQKKLTELTGVEWSIRRKNSKGDLRIHKLSPSLVRADNFWLCTAGKIRTAAGAEQALCDYVNEGWRVPRAAMKKGAAEIAIPAKRALKLLDIPIQEGALADAFVPSDPQAREAESDRDTEVTPSSISSIFSPKNKSR